MLIVMSVLILLAIVLLPNLWVQHVLRKHSKVRKDFPGDGADMARHLIARHGIDGVVVESTELGDHYDASKRAVRLTQDKFAGRSLTAVVVAAHEVGHALQHHRQEPMFITRGRLAVFSAWVQRLAPVALLATPLLAFVNPAVSRWSILIALGAMLISTLVHLVTLPVELDASFGKALPMLQQGEYLDAGDMAKARTILRAAAFTYVAGSLMSLLNVWRWLRFLRR